jgi:hypothetical protein
VTKGSKSALLQAIRNGQQVRVGFGLDFDGDGKPDLEHFADAMFISVYQGEVFAQLAPIQEQRPKAGVPEIRLATPRHPWTGMLDTTGRLLGWFPEEVPSEHRVIGWWFVSGQR